MHWRPLLPASRREAAFDVVKAIVADTMQRFQSGSLDRSLGLTRRGTLAVGSAGVALLLEYAARNEVTLGDPAEDLVSDLLNHAIEAAGTAPSLGLYGGFPGAAWVVRHLEQPCESGDFVEDCPLGEDADELVVRALEQTAWLQHFDLFSGLVGLGTYALQRWPGCFSERTLRAVIHHLKRMAVRKDNGFTWHTPEHHMWPEEVAAYPALHEFTNLGVARGVAGVVGFLAQASATSIERDTTRELLEGAVEWLLSQRQEGGDHTGFPRWVGRGVQSGAARLAWCNGDLGISLMLLQAASATGNPRWNQAAVAVGLRAAERTLHDSEIVDACLCHGAAGAGHLFGRLYQKTCDERFRHAAAHWLEIALDMRRPGTGVAGYQTWERASWLHGGTDQSKTWRDDVGLMAGATGIGLALLSAASDSEPEWDQVLLLSAPGALARAAPGAEHVATVRGGR